MVTEKLTCTSCRFFHADKQECRIRAPRVLLRSDEGPALALWPNVGAEDWCGEHSRSRLLAPSWYNESVAMLRTNLKARAVTVLEELGVRTVGEVAALRDAQLEGTKNVGQVTILSIKNAVEDFTAMTWREAHQLVNEYRDSLYGGADRVQQD